MLWEVVGGICERGLLVSFCVMKQERQEREGEKGRERGGRREAAV